MLTPAANPSGYSNTSVIAAASTSFDADAWHLFHGTADDNVHVQNAMLLVDRLIDLDMPIAEAFFFPNRAHVRLQTQTQTDKRTNRTRVRAVPTEPIRLHLALFVSCCVFICPLFQSMTQWKTGKPPRYLYERLIRILTGQGGPNGNGAYKPISPR
jgi:hypothetical protein